MTTVTTPHSTTPAMRKAVQTVIRLQATTAAVAGAALKRWSIIWGNPTPQHELNGNPVIAETR